VLRTRGGGYSNRDEHVISHRRSKWNVLIGGGCSLGQLSVVIGHGNAVSGQRDCRNSARAGIDTKWQRPLGCCALVPYLAGLFAQKSH